MKNCIIASKNPNNSHLALFCAPVLFHCGADARDLAPTPTRRTNVPFFHQISLPDATLRAVGYSAAHEPYLGAYWRASRLEGRVRGPHRALSQALLTLRPMQIRILPHRDSAARLAGQTAGALARRRRSAR